MPSDDIIGFFEPTRPMTIDQGLTFIERTRRQVERFELLPRAPGQTITPEHAADIRRQCDAAEADINRFLSNG
jgi:hypothetical protein